jgi:hypothetical protein
MSKGSFFSKTKNILVCDFDVFKAMRMIMFLFWILALKTEDGVTIAL